MFAGLLSTTSPFWSWPKQFRCSTWNLNIVQKTYCSCSGKHTIKFQVFNLVIVALAKRFPKQFSFFFWTAFIVKLVKPIQVFSFWRVSDPTTGLGRGQLVSFRVLMKVFFGASNKKTSKIRIYHPLIFYIWQLPWAAIFFFFYFFFL